MNLVKAGRKPMVRVLFCVLLALACQDEPPSGSERVCFPGITQTCSGPGRCDGVQSCLASGDGYGTCDCGPAPDAGPIEVGPICTPGERQVCSGEGACGGVQVCDASGDFGACDCSGLDLRVNTLGAPCQTDGDCGPDLECWSTAAEGRAAFIGGAAHGYCTRTCEVLADCAALGDPLPACSPPGVNGARACLRGCLSKDPALGESKCLNRLDQICLSAAAIGVEPFSTTTRQAGACLPSCGSDADCEGRFCDLASGFCLDQPALGAAIGAACILGTECAGGVCSAFPSGTSFCTSSCSLDGLGCGYDTDANPRGAACIIPWFNEGGVTEGRQDLGMCAELCNVTADCTQPDWACDTSSGGVPGSSGVCVPEADLVGSEPAPDAGPGAPAP